MDVDKYIGKLDPPLKAIVQELRKIITNLSSDMKEEIKWNVPTYSINKNICSVMAHKKHVNLQIFLGAHIKDAQELDGAGKDMRHLKFSALNEVEEEKISKYLKQAIQLDQ